MKGTCLVTGGAGFLGCALSGGLADRFDRVVVVDNLHPQVHATPERPAALDGRVELVVGDVTDAGVWDRVLSGMQPEVVVHLAAETGTAQSLTEATRHGSVNVVGTAAMLDALVRHETLPERVVLASSRAVYGEGAWADASGTVTYPGQRSPRMLAAGEWDFAGLRPVPSTAALTHSRPTSVYGATKLAQEHLLAAWCGSEAVRAVVLRLQNVYGPGQSLTNPHTGVVSFFAQLAKKGEAIPVYEDGEILRDFLYVDDAVRALLAAVDEDGSADGPCDIGSALPTTILRVAQMVASVYDAPEPQVTGQYRLGDVRSASCDVAPAASHLGWAPRITPEDGIRRLCEWLDQSIP